MSRPTPATSFPKDMIKVLLLENIHASASEIFGAEHFQVERVKGAMKPAELAAKINTSTTGLTRSWEYWLGRLGRAGLMVPETKAVPNRGRAPVKASSRGARKAPSRTKARRR